MGSLLAHTHSLTPLLPLLPPCSSYPCQGVGSLLASRRGQDWEKLISWVHESDGLGSELDWAVNAISTSIQQAQ